MMPTPSAEDRLARFLRGAVVVVAAALVLLVPRFSTRASFLGLSSAPDPVVTLLVGLALRTMPILVAASWAAAGRVRLAHPWLLLPVGLFVAGAVVSTASASDKAAAVVRAAEMTGAWAAFFALLQVLRTGADRRFLLGAVVATAAVSAGLALAQETQDRPFVLAAVMLLALPVAVALAVEKWRRIRTRGARGLAVVLVVSALGLAAALVVRHGAWLRAEEPAAWRGAAAMFLDRGLAGVGLENFEWHYAAYEPLAFGGAPVRAGNVWLAVGSEMGLAGLAAAAALVVLVVRAWCRRSAVPYAEGAGASLLVRLGPVVVLRRRHSSYFSRWGCGSAPACWPGRGSSWRWRRPIRRRGCVWRTGHSGLCDGDASPGLSPGGFTGRRRRSFFRRRRRGRCWWCWPSRWSGGTREIRRARRAL